MTKSQIKAALRRAAARCVERDLRWCLCSALPEQAAFNATWAFEEAGTTALLAGDESAYFLLIVAEVLE